MERNPSGSIAFANVCPKGGGTWTRIYYTLYEDVCGKGDRRV
jgi:hypothetical protein